MKLLTGTDNMSRLTKMLMRHEGTETHAYPCSEGKLTIGVGRNIDPDGGLGISPWEIEFLLQNDINRVEEELYDHFPEWLEDEGLDYVRLDAIIDICFNLGLTRFLGFEKALAAMQNRDYDTAAYEFLNSRWADQVGNRAIELAEMIRSGEYSND